MLALSLVAWCAVLALLALAAELGGLTELALALAHWTQVLFLAFVLASLATALVNLPPLRRLWPLRARRLSAGASGSLGEL